MKHFNTTYLKRWTLVITLGSLSPTFGQVGINTTAPADGAILDVHSLDKGLLIPRVTIADLSTIAPINPTSAAEISLLVYNTNSATGEGFYYWNGSRWVGIDGEKDWKTSGNAGTTAGTGTGQHYLGTSDNEPLIIATQGIERARILEDGRMAVNNASPQSVDRFAVTANSNEYAVNGYSSGTGVGVYGENSGSGIGLFGLASGTGYSVFGLDGPIYGDNTYLGGEGVIGFTDSSGLENGVWGVNLDTGGTAVLGGTGNLYILSADGSGVAGSSGHLGVFGYAGNGAVATANRGNVAGEFVLDSDFDPDTDNDRARALLAGFDRVSPDGSQSQRNSYFGGYFSGGDESSPTYAYVGMRYHTNSSGTSGTDYKIIGTGSVSTIVKGSDGQSRIMFAPESPEIVFQDSGIGTLVAGQTFIALDPLLRDAIVVDDHNPLRVFITLEGDCNGVYVTEKSSRGFRVKELNQGKSNVSFSWQIIASRADTKDASGNIVSKHQGLRFPEAPTALKRTNPRAKSGKPSFKSNAKRKLE